MRLFCKKVFVARNKTIQVPSFVENLKFKVLTTFFQGIIRFSMALKLGLII